eukprot:scaffold13207_cov143-Cylindrotheca_fusiformis.AAC.16
MEIVRVERPEHGHNYPTTSSMLVSYQEKHAVGRNHKAFRHFQMTITVFTIIYEQQKVSSAFSTLQVPTPFSSTHDMTIREDPKAIVRCASHKKESSTVDYATFDSLNMNRDPIDDETTETSESLVRLAALADVVSRQNKPVPASRDPSAADDGFGSGPPLRKRPTDATDFRAPSKKLKNGDIDSGAHGDVRFREYQAEIWSEKFEDLVEFRKYYGHCHVPHCYQRNAPLAQWVKRQRYQYKLKVDGKRSTLSDERVRLLNKIGFIWNSHDAVWEERWNELLLYKRIHGDCVVPSNYEKNPQLAVWVKRQRRQYKFYSEDKPTSMTKERIAKLEKLGFAWDCRKTKPNMEHPTSLDRQDQETESTDAVVTKALQVVLAPESDKKGSMKLPKCEFFTFSRNFS